MANEKWLTDETYLYFDNYDNKFNGQDRDSFMYKVFDKMSEDGNIEIYTNAVKYNHNGPLFGCHIAHHAVEMMWKYGTTKHSVEEYRRRATINCVHLGERSSAHDVIDYILLKDGEPSSGNNSHASKGFSTIWQYVDHFRPIACNSPGWYLYMNDLVADLKEKYGDDVKIICSNSTGNLGTNKPSSDWDDTYQCFKIPNVIGFTAMGNICTTNEGNKIGSVVQYDSDLPSEDNGGFRYGPGSYANPPDTFKVRNYAVVGLNYRMTDVKVSYNGSCFPYGFDNDYVIGSCTMPYNSQSAGGRMVTDVGNQPSSFNTTSTAARAILCAQVWPDLEDVQEIMDYFAKTRRDNKVSYTYGELRAEITCIDVGELFRDKAMPTEVPTEVPASGSVSLPRGVYPGVLFSGPGVTVKAGDQWIAVTKENQAIIEGLDPMNLECSFDPSLAMSQGYTDKVEIEAIAIDDTFLALDKGVKYTITINNQQK